MLWKLTRFTLNGKADFDDEKLQFNLYKPVACSTPIPAGTYALTRETVASHRYRIGHPLAQKLIGECKDRTPGGHISGSIIPHGLKKRGA